MSKQIETSKFLKIFFCFFILFIFFHAVVWNLYTKQIFGRDDNLYIGDLGRGSYQVDSLYPRKLEFNLKRQHLDNNDTGVKIDILTIGDSFSNADQGGLNPYYQDYLATYYDLNVLNLQRHSSSSHSFELIIDLLNSGWLKQYKPKMIILQSVARMSSFYYAKDFDFNASKPSIKNIFQSRKTINSYIPRLKFINNANYKLVYYSLLYMFKYNANKSFPILTLNQDFFTNKNFSNKLLITNQDIQFIKKNEDLAYKMNENFNTLAKKLKDLNIQLVFMLSVDKYDLYSDFIVSNPYPNNNLFKEFTKMKKDYIFINTKEILQTKLRTGIKDIYYPDDTHWSYKASDIIAKDKVFKKLLKDLKNEN